VLLVPLGIFLLWRFWPRAGDSGLDPNAQPRPVTPAGELSQEEQMTIAIYEKASPGVAHVTNLAVRRGGGPLSLEAQGIPRGTGTGFVWDKEGHIVTNFHVVEGADAAQVTLADHSTYTTDAQHIWVDPDDDIAVIFIRAPANKLHPIPIRTSHDLKVGQRTFAIGNPYGLDQTLTTGIVSALGREIESPNNRPIRGVIQTSAAINPGNSGGPLLDSSGLLMGMNTSILSPSGAFAGIGFAIPSDEINRIVPQLIRAGKVDRPRLGVELAPDQTARKVGIDQGVLILRVRPDTPAAAAGLQGTYRDEDGNLHLGDIITAIGDQSITNANDLYRILQDKKAGDTLTVHILRNDEPQTVQLKL
jgi:S1-C subfamily serine protease